MENALAAFDDPKERKLKLAVRDDAVNRKKPFWSSKVHGIPQGYAADAERKKQQELPQLRQWRGAGAAAQALTRPQSANAVALQRRDVKLTDKDKEANELLVHHPEVLVQIESKLKSAVVTCTPVYEKHQTILIRAFQTFDQDGRGTIPLSAFQKALACFQIETSEVECRALFQKFGQDLQRRMPYEVFTQALFASEQRMIAWTGIKKGPFEMARTTKQRKQNEEHLGKIQPLQSGGGKCVTGVYPPSDWNKEKLKRAGEKPDAELELQHVYGYAGKTKKTVTGAIDPVSSDMSPNLFFSSTGEVVYFTAAVGIVHDWQKGKTNKQRFFQSHDDDVLCLTMDPSRTYAATGQTAPLKLAKGVQCKPTVSVWDVNSMQELVQLEHAPVKRSEESTEEEPMAGVQAVAFSADGELLVSVCRNLRATVHVWRWRQAQLVCKPMESLQGTPPCVWGIAWNDSTDGGRNWRDPPKDPNDAIHFATFGVKHIKFWTRKEIKDVADKGAQQEELWKADVGIFNEKADGSIRIQDVLCCEYWRTPNGQLRAVTGMASGDLYLWRDEQTADKRDGGSQMKVYDKATYDESSGSKGEKPIKRGAHVRNLCAIRVRTIKDENTKKVVQELLTGGGGGTVKIWRIDPKGDNLALMGIIELPNKRSPGKPPPGIKALDFRPIGKGRLPELLIGTDQCDILRIMLPKDSKPEANTNKYKKNEVLECLDEMVKGHSDKVHGLAPYPHSQTKSSKGQIKSTRFFATASKSEKVFLWNAEQKMPMDELEIKHVADELELTACAFNHKGNRLAVGAKSGHVIILEVNVDSEAIEANLDPEAIKARREQAKKEGKSSKPPPGHSRAGALKRLFMGLDPDGKPILGPDDKPEAITGPDGNPITGPDRKQILSGSAMPAIRDSTQEIAEMKFSPDDRTLAVASHDQYIYLYAANDDKYGMYHPQYKKTGQRYLARCQGHSATVSHLDWSIDSKMLQSNCNAYELLYWHADRAGDKRQLGLQVKHDQRDTKWHSWSCIIGFDVMGMFPSGYDNTDINSVARSDHRFGTERDDRYVAVGTDRGAVLLFNYPPVVAKAPYFIYPGHSSHVANVQWMPNLLLDVGTQTKEPKPDEPKLLISAGGNDRAIFQWKLVNEQREPWPNETAASIGAPTAAAPAAAAAGELRSDSFMQQQEKLKQQEQVLAAQDEQINELRERLALLEHHVVKEKR